MKNVETKGTFSQEQRIQGTPIVWCGDIYSTLTALWSNIQINKPQFHQLTMKFDRAVEHHAETIRLFFNQKDVFSVVSDYNDPKVGDRSWITLIKFHKYSK